MLDAVTDYSFSGFGMHHSYDKPYTNGKVRVSYSYNIRGHAFFSLGCLYNYGNICQDNITRY